MHTSVETACGNAKFNMKYPYFRGIHNEGLILGAALMKFYSYIST